MFTAPLRCANFPAAPESNMPTVIGLLGTTLAFAAVWQESGQNQVSQPRQPGETWVESESSWQAFFRETDHNIIVDIENTSLNGSPTLPVIPIKPDWIVEWASGQGREVKPFGDGYAIYRSGPRENAFGVPYTRQHLLWLASLDNDAIKGLLRERMAMHQLDGNGWQAAQNLATLLPQGPGALFGDTSDFQIGLSAEVTLEGKTTDGLDRLMTIPYTPRRSSAPEAPVRRPRALPTVLELPEGTPRVVYPEEGVMITAFEIADRLSREHGIYLTFDARLWRERVFIKGSWSPTHLADAVLEMSDSRRGRYYNQTEVEQLTEAASEKILQAILEVMGLPEDAVEAAKNGETWPLKRVLEVWPELGARMAANERLTDESPFKLGLRFTLDLVGPGSVRESGESSNHYANSASLLLRLIKQ